MRPLNAAIAEFARLYASEFQLLPLGWLLTTALLLLSAFLGLCGAMLFRVHDVKATRHALDVAWAIKQHETA